MLLAVALEVFQETTSTGVAWQGPTTTVTGLDR
jgi:hypothetical protein